MQAFSIHVCDIETEWHGKEYFLSTAQSFRFDCKAGWFSDQNPLMPLPWTQKNPGRKTDNHNEL